MKLMYSAKRRTRDAHQCARDRGRSQLEPQRRHADRLGGRLAVADRLQSASDARGLDVARQSPPPAARARSSPRTAGDCRRRTRLVRGRQHRHAARAADEAPVHHHGLADHRDRHGGDREEDSAQAQGQHADRESQRPGHQRRGGDEQRQRRVESLDTAPPRCTRPPRRRRPSRSSRSRRSRREYSRRWRARRTATPRMPAKKKYSFCTTRASTSAEAQAARPRR